MLKIFDRKSIIISKNKAFKNWEKSNFLFKYVSSDVAEKVLELGDYFKNILLVTADAYEIFEKIQKIKNNQIFFLSEYSKLFNLIKTKKSSEHIILSDFENIMVKNIKFDLIICNLCLHKINDISSFLKKLNHLSKNKGLLICTYFGGKSLSELRNTLIRTDEIIKNRIYQRVIPLIDMIDATNMFKNAGFEEIITDKSSIKVKYKNLRSLLIDIRNMGENNSLTNRPKGLISYNYFKRAEKFYKDFYSDNDNKLLATCDIISLTMWNKGI